MDTVHIRRDTVVTAITMALIGYRQYKLPMAVGAFEDAAAIDRLRRVCAKVAKRLAIDFDPHSHIGLRTREIAFYDTRGFALRDAGFIVRTRAPLDADSRMHGLELALRFRDADPEAAAAIDMRPLLPCTCAMKFKQEILPAHGGADGLGILYANDCILESPNGALIRHLATLAHAFPAFEAADRARGGAEAELVRVNGRRIEERLLRLGRLYFGPRIACTPSLAIWRDRATGRGLIAEFSYQLRFRSLAALPRKADDAATALFAGLRSELGAWVTPEATKTAQAYAGQPDAGPA